ncbi:MAG: YIP1 family protein [Anaerolineae bacterium]|nr:YIP1 family protein [Anaerolineae bacterium]
MAGIAENLPTVAERAISQNGRRRSLTGHVSLLLFQPGAFFRLLPPLHANRQWLWIAVIALALTGLYAVRTAAPSAETGDPVSMPVDTGSFDAPGGGFDPGFIPDAGPPPDIGLPSAGGGVDVATNWSTALVAAAGLVVQWLALGVILGEVSLFNGLRPQFGKNLQIAIWASVPLALMTLLQLIYISAGGSVGAPGIAGLLSDWDGFAGLSPLMRDILWSLFATVTLFWLWSLTLVYIGARQALHGKRWAVLITLIGWVMVLVVVPVALGRVSAPEAASDEAGLIEMPMDDLGMPESFGEDVLPGGDEMMEEGSEAEVPVRPAAPLNRIG